MLFKRNKLGKYHTNFTRSHREPAFYFLKKIFKKGILIAFVFGIIYFIFFSSFFAVKSVEIEGNKLVSKSKILETMPMGQNIFVYPTSDLIQKFLQKYPEIESADISKGLPNTIRIEVTEYFPEIYWVRNNSKGLVNKNGVFYFKAPENEKTKELVKVVEQVQSEVQVGEQVTTPSFIEFVKTTKETFASYNNLTFDHIEIDASSFDIVVKTKENIDVLMATDDDVIRQLSYLTQILEKRRDKVTKKIDVRIPRWGYVE